MSNLVALKGHQSSRVLSAGNTSGGNRSFIYNKTTLSRGMHRLRECTHKKRACVHTCVRTQADTYTHDSTPSRRRWPHAEVSARQYSVLLSTGNHHSLFRQPTRPGARLLASQLPSRFINWPILILRVFTIPIYAHAITPIYRSMCEPRTVWLILIYNIE